MGRGRRGREREKKEHEKRRPRFAGTLHGCKLCSGREQQQMRYRAQKPVMEARDLKAQKYEIGEPDDVQEQIGKPDRSAAAGAPIEESERSPIEQHGSGRRSLGEQQRQRRHGRGKPEYGDVGGAQPDRNLRGLRPALPRHWTNLRRSPRRIGGNGGAPALAIASSRASASRIRPRCERPAAAGTLTPRA